MELSCCTFERNIFKWCFGDTRVLTNTFCEHILIGSVQNQIKLKTHWTGGFTENQTTKSCGKSSSSLEQPG